MPKQKRWALKQRLHRAQEHMLKALALLGSVQEEVYEAHPEETRPLVAECTMVVVAFGGIDKYREAL